MNVPTFFGKNVQRLLMDEPIFFGGGRTERGFARGRQLDAELLTLCDQTR